MKKIYYHKNFTYQKIGQDNQSNNICCCSFKPRRRSFCSTFNFVKRKKYGVFVLKNSNCLANCKRIAKEILVEVYKNYAKYADVFFEKTAIKLLEHTMINNYLTNLKNSTQPFYKLCYNFGLVELKMLKIYIIVNFKTRFIRPSKSHTETLILFFKKPNCLYRLSRSK